MNEAIIQAKQIDEQSKQAGFYQEALDFTARKGFGNGRMDVDMEEGLEVVKEFDIDELIESEPLQTRTKKDLNQGLSSIRERVLYKRFRKACSRMYGL